MVHRPLRPLTPSRAATGLYDEWLAQLEDRLADPEADRNALCRDVLHDLYFPGLPNDVDEAGLPLAARVALADLDPRNVTLEPEYYHEIDPERYYPRKPLLWLWQMFDRSPLGGNVHLGVRFRRILAPHVFASVGRNFKCFHFVEVSFGYNLEVGDDVVVHRNVLLDDRGGIRLGDRVSISDFASVFSHTHSIDDMTDVTNARTVLEDDVRVTYGATVLAGVHVGVQGMVGARAVATRDVRPYHVNVGIPAKSVAIKSFAPGEHLRKTSTGEAE
ncbi:MAG: acyltransferase [Candidatus Palauibacterales bacterium]|nr:acyltransferase [Candidatus Palauibacterales bacterium]MDP2584256.1 acyltransferase [Candidatus Palauibacterales bacterium]